MLVKRSSESQNILKLGFGILRQNKGIKSQNPKTVSEPLYRYDYGILTLRVKTNSDTNVSELRALREV